MVSYAKIRRKTFLIVHKYTITLMNSYYWPENAQWLFQPSEL
jgi:hypothetical protein